MPRARDGWREWLHEQEPHAERSGEGWTGRLYDAAPVQGEGTIDGHRWYFRARGDHWSFSIPHDPSVDPVDVPPERGYFKEAPWGRRWQASPMPYPEAWRLIELCFEEWRAGRAGEAHLT